MAATAHRVPLLIRFFDPTEKGRDARGRSLPDILAWTDDKLEFSHDYIQMLFPLPEGSIFNSLAPVVTREVRDAFIQRQDLRGSLLQAFDRILGFYGLATAVDEQEGRGDNALAVVKGTKWATNSSNWVCRFNHNHLRISRIIRSLRVLGAEQQAAALFTCLAELDEVREKVSKRSLMYWERAAKRPLHLPPDEDDENAAGIRWLSDVTSQAGSTSS